MKKILLKIVYVVLLTLGIISFGLGMEYYTPRDDRPLCNKVYDKIIYEVRDKNLNIEFNYSIETPPHTKIPLYQLSPESGLEILDVHTYGEDWFCHKGNLIVEKPKNPELCFKWGVSC